MEKPEVIKMINEAVKSLKNGTWTLPGITIAFLGAIKYLVENQKGG